MRIGWKGVVIRADSDREEAPTWRLESVADSSFGVQIEYRWELFRRSHEQRMHDMAKRKRDGRENPAMLDRDQSANGRVDEGGEKAGGRLSVQQAMMVLR